MVVDQRCQHQADHSPFASIQVGVVKVATMLPATTLKPTFTGPRLPVAKAGRVSVSRAALRVRAGPYDEELIATAVRRPGLSIDQISHKAFCGLIIRSSQCQAASRLCFPGEALDRPCLEYHSGHYL